MADERASEWELVTETNNNATHRLKISEGWIYRETKHVSVGQLLRCNSFDLLCSL